MHGIARFAIPLLATIALAAPAVAAPDWAQVGKALGTSGAVQAAGV